MIIEKVTLSHHKIPLKHPFITALRRVEAVEFLRVHIHTDSGEIGIGEAPPTKAITGETVKSIRQAIEQNITPKLLGLTIAEAKEIIFTCKENFTSALGAIDIALHDLLPDTIQLKVSTLKTAITISLDSPQMMAIRAQEALKAGLDILKVKVGGKDSKDFERIKAVCKVAKNATILLDANQAWSSEEALNIIGKIETFNIALIEQALIANDLEGMAMLTCKSTIPILADESAFNLDEVKKVLKMQAADMINIKLMKCGGISKAREIIEYCETQNIICMMGSMLEGPYSIKAAALLAMEYPQTVKYIDLDSPLLYKDITQGRPLHFKKNELSL